MADDGLQGLAPVHKLGPVGVVPNQAWQIGPGEAGKGFLRADDYQLAIVEFDDQGRCYQRPQLDSVSDRIEAMRAGREDAIVLVFVHGWKHNARSDDQNLTAFRALLVKTARHEAGVAAAGGAAPRPVMGIFIGWRGLTAHGVGDLIADATFWGRQEAAHRVATGTVRELFGRLRHYRNALLKAGGSPLLVIAGHSFGGMIVFSALAQSLIESASAPADHVIPGFADLVLLVNPAVEGARYLPIHDLVTAPAFRGRAAPQLPVFVCVQADNDQPVGTWFPVGNFKNRLEEASIGDLERRCVTHAIGFIDEFRTHRIDGPLGAQPFRLDPPAIQQPDPFWVVRAGKDVVDGHGGIWGDTFMLFLAALVFQHVRTSGTPVPQAGATRSVAQAVTAKVAAAPPAEATLADYARSIQPLVQAPASVNPA